jgi:hypothetical protein
LTNHGLECGLSVGFSSHARRAFGFSSSVIWPDTWNSKPGLVDRGPSMLRPRLWPIEKNVIAQSGGLSAQALRNSLICD